MSAPLEAVPDDVEYFYGPPRLAVAICALAGLAALLFGWHETATGDKPGAVLAYSGGALLVLTALWLRKPVLVMDGDGVQIRELWGTHYYPWEDVSAFKSSSQLRRGLRQRSLEVDADDHLHLVADFLLGRPVDDIVATAEQLRDN
jgi:hypothetical protein